MVLVSVASGLGFGCFYLFRVRWIVFSEGMVVYVVCLCSFGVED